MAKLTEGLGGGPREPIDLRAWCEETNATKLMERMERWYFVHKGDEGEAIDTIEGVDAKNVRRLIAGQPVPDFYGWPEARMTGYRRWLWNVARAGTTVPIRPQLEPVE
jgi:hypothetical protein